MVLPLAAIPITVTHPIHCIGSFQLDPFHDDPSKRTNLHFLAFKMLWLPLIKDGEEWVIKKKEKRDFTSDALKYINYVTKTVEKISVLSFNRMLSLLRSSHISVTCQFTAIAFL